MNKFYSCHYERPLCISSVIADYSIRIEDRNFAQLFKKLEPTSSRSEASLKAWSAIGEKHLIIAETERRAIARAWLNSYARKWNKECDTESKRQNMKDEDGNLIYTLLPSKSPLGEFAEASFRSKSRRCGVLP